MNSSHETLRAMVLGYMWNQPVQQLNHLFEPQLGAPRPKAVTETLHKLTPNDRATLKAEFTGILAREISSFFQTLEEKGRRGEVLDLSMGGFTEHVPPWEDDLSYFDAHGNPKVAA